MSRVRWHRKLCEQEELIRLAQRRILQQQKKTHVQQVQLETSPFSPTLSTFTNKQKQQTNNAQHRTKYISDK